MYFKNTIIHLLVKSLKKKGWSTLNKESEYWLKQEPYYILIGDGTFVLFCDIRHGDELVKLQSFNYGRRQSQLLERAVDKHKREMILKCINFSSKEEA